MPDIRFDDRVALVTGSGGGLGRSHALLLASSPRGCSFGRPDRWEEIGDLSRAQPMSNATETAGQAVKAALGQ